MTEENTLEVLIEQATEQERQEAKERDAAVKTKIKDLLTAIQNALGPHFKTLHPYMKPYSTSQHQNSSAVSVPVEASALGLSYFEVVAQETYKETRVYLRVGSTFQQNTQANVGDNLALAKFFKARRESFIEAQAAEKKKLFDEVRQKLTYHYQGVAFDDRACAVTTYEELIAICPERMEEAQVAFATWEDWAEESRAASERAAQEKAKKRALKKEYAPRYLEWLQKRRAIEGCNAVRLEEAQNKLDVPYCVWELTYAYVADDEDAGHVADTGQVYVTAPEPDATAFWNVLRSSGMERRKFFHPVSISDKIVTKASDGLIARRHCIGSNTLYSHPRMTNAAVRALLELEEVPEKPEVPEGLDPCERVQLEQSLYKLVYRESASSDELAW